MALTEKELIFAFGLPSEDAVKYLQKKGIRVSKDWKDTLKKIKDDVFLITGVTNIKNLQYVRDLILKALNEGLPLKEFKEKIKDLLKLPDWHAKLVLTQNISNSYNAGRLKLQLEDWQDFPYLRPVVIMDKKTTAICRFLYLSNLVIKINDPNLKYASSPRHFHCRTIWVVISETQRKRMGLKVVNIKDIPKKYWNDPHFQRLPNLPLSKNDFEDLPAELVKQIKPRRRA